jgi:hypothetical protein
MAASSTRWRLWSTDSRYPRGLPTTVLSMALLAIGCLSTTVGASIIDASDCKLISRVPDQRQTFVCFKYADPCVPQYTMRTMRDTVRGLRSLGGFRTTHLSDLHELVAGTIFLHCSGTHAFRPSLLTSPLLVPVTIFVCTVQFSTGGKLWTIHNVHGHFMHGAHVDLL